MTENGTTLPVWRSLLYVPVNVERFVDRAHTRGADVIQLDLEDSVPPSEKAAARRLLSDAVRRVSRGGADVAVRINRPWRMAMQDLEHAVIPGVHALAVTKVDSADHLRMVDEVVSELEAERALPHGHVKLLAMVETARGFLHSAEIAAASTRVAALTLGAEDFALSLGMLPEAEGLLFPKQQIVVAAAAAGVLPLGFVGTVAEYKNAEAFRQIVRRSRKLGFRGASAIHPSQVPILNEEFGPTPDEVAQARRVIAAYEQAAAAGRGSIEVDGRMVDVPIVQRAEATLRLAEAVREREQRARG